MIAPGDLGARAVRGLGRDRVGYALVSAAACAVDFLVTLELTWSGVAPAAAAAEHHHAARLLDHEEQLRKSRRPGHVDGLVELADLLQADAGAGTLASLFGGGAPLAAQPIMGDDRLAGRYLLRRPQGP